MKHFKTIAILFTIITAITATALGWVKLPGRVDVVEEEMEEIKEEVREDKSNLEKLASSLDKYIAVQEVRNELMMKTWERDKTP